MRAHCLLGRVFLDSCQVSSCSFHINEGRKIYEELNDNEAKVDKVDKTDDLVNTYKTGNKHNINNSDKINNTDKTDAVPSGNGCIELAKKVCEKKAEMKAYLDVGKMHLFAMKQYDDAVLCFKKCIDLARESKEMEVRTDEN
jgi:hypothetical protein